MKMYHATTPVNARDVLTGGLKINATGEAGYTQIYAQWADQLYDMRPVFLSVKKGKFEGIPLIVDVTGLPLVADLAAIADLGDEPPSLEGDELVWWDGMGPEELSSISYDGAVNVTRLLQPGSKETKLAIEITGTAAILENIPADRIKIARYDESVIRKYVSLLLTEARTRQPGDLSQEELLALTEYVLTGNGVYDFTEKFAGSHAELTQAPDTGEFTSRSKQARAHGRPGQAPQGVAKKIADQMTSLPTPERSRRFTFELIDVVNRPDYINYLVGDKPVAVEYSGMLTKEEANSLNSAQEHITFISRDDIRHTNFNISEADTLVIENIREKLSAGRVSRSELRHAGLKIADVLARSVPASVLGGPIEGFMVQQGGGSYKVVNPEYARVQRLQAPLYAAFGGRSNMSKRDIRSRLMNPAEGDRMIQDIKRYLESVSEMPEGFRTFFSSEAAEEISTALDSAISGDADAGDRVYRRINHRVNDRDSWVNT